MLESLITSVFKSSKTYVRSQLCMSLLIWWILVRCLLVSRVARLSLVRVSRRRGMSIVWSVSRSSMRPVSSGVRSFKRPTCGRGSSRVLILSGIDRRWSGSRHLDIVLVLIKALVFLVAKVFQKFGPMLRHHHANVADLHVTFDGNDLAKSDSRGRLHLFARMIWRDRSWHLCHASFALPAKIARLSCSEIDYSVFLRVTAWFRHTPIPRCSDSTDSCQIQVQNTAIKCAHQAKTKCCLRFTFTITKRRICE